MTGLPVVYVVHTLFGLELASYGPPRLRGALGRIGRLVDRVAARRSDGVIALGEAARRRLAPLARGPVSVIPPGLDPAPEPGAAEVAATCAAHGVTPGGFAIYAGNLDAYQELDRLERAAREVPELPVLVATHAELPARSGALRFARVTHPDEARQLVFGAALALLPRRHGAGFPIKLLNYMEASRAIVATEGVVDGLAHERSAWLLPVDAPASALADAMRRLAGDPTLAAHLGTGARAVLVERHAWPDLARRTLRLAAAVAR
jgi:glycosyltransferase involved in cell wall biosynthesis